MRAECVTGALEQEHGGLWELRAGRRGLLGRQRLVILGHSSVGVLAERGRLGGPWIVHCGRAAGLTLDTTAAAPAASPSWRHPRRRAAGSWQHGRGTAGSSCPSPPQQRPRHVRSSRAALLELKGIIYCCSIKLSPAAPFPLYYAAAAHRHHVCGPLAGWSTPLVQFSRSSVVLRSRAAPTAEPFTATAGAICETDGASCPRRPCARAAATPTRRALQLP